MTYPKHVPTDPPDPVTQLLDAWSSITRSSHRDLGWIKKIAHALNLARNVYKDASKTVRHY